MLWILSILSMAGLALTISLAVLKKRELATLSLAAMIAMTPIAAGIGAASGPIATGIAQTGAVSGYQQYLNGTVVNVYATPYQCARDGSCTHWYNCDSYTVVVSAAYTDKDGNYHPEVDETDYHHCPVATMEFTYTIVAKAYHTFVWNIVDHGFAAHPIPWCCASEVDGNTTMDPNVPRGVPTQWLKAYHDWKAGHSDPVTVKDSYSNYILANEHTLLRQHSDDIGMLRKKHLLPPGPLPQIYDTYLANKVDFVGLDTVPADQRVALQNAVASLNADLGTNLQGDMHVVAVNADALQGTITPQDYATAIEADRLNDYEKDAMAKNAILLVVGVNPTTNTIAWSQAATGMPIGNDEMLAALDNQLKGVAFTSNAMFGDTIAKVVQTANDDYDVHYTAGNGIVSQIVMVQHKFLRACMDCQSARDKKVNAGQQNFVYLKTELPLPGWGVIVTIIVDLVALAIALVLVYWIDSFVRSFFGTPKTPTRSTRSHTGGYR